MNLGTYSILFQKMRLNFIGNLGTVGPSLRRGGERGPLVLAGTPSCGWRPLLCFLLGMTLAALLPLVPGWLYRKALPAQAYTLLLEDTRDPRVTHLSVRPPVCDGGGATHIHLLITVQGVSGKLSLSLPSNMRALGKALGTVYILTSPEDDKIVHVAAGASALGSVEVFQSRVYTHNGAMLNMAGAKSWMQATAREACTSAGRMQGAYFVFLDADILLPHDFGERIVPLIEDVAASSSDIGQVLFSMHRNFYATPEDANAGVTSPCPPPDKGGCEAFLGYFQLFSASTPILYDTWSADVAYHDNSFRAKFTNASLLPGAVAHLGRAGGDWTGLFVRDEPQWEGSVLKGFTTPP